MGNELPPYFEMETVMTHNIWDGLIPATDLKAYETAGFGATGGIGNRPALLIIDVQYRTAGTKRQDIESAMKEFPTSCGQAAWDAIKHIQPLLSLFRQRHWPVIYPHVAPKQGYDAGRLAGKVPTMMGIQPHGYNFVSEVAPNENDILIPKKHPSAFFGTSLTSHLIDLQVDTLVMVGCTTSGCIRASVVDGFSHNFHIVVPSDCVYDRGIVPHAVNLFDMAQKYADVMPSSTLIEKLIQL